jgi:CheY-like chemotaxis protein
MAGYQVFEAANLDATMRALEQHPVDVVLTALDLPPKGSSAVIAAMCKRPEWRGIPILELADSAEQIQAQAGQEMDYEKCRVKFDREAVLESVARLASVPTPSEALPVCSGKEQ